MEKRLGADIMIVPSGSKENAESMLLEGQRSTFYFNRSVYDNLTKLDGVSDITAQCFLKSLSEDCCTSEVSIVFYDPQKDFIVGPWIQNLNHKTKSQQGNEKETVVVGYNVDVTKENNIKLFGREYTVAGQMAKTGTNLDDSVYFSFEAMKDVSERAEKKGAFLTDIQKKEDIISSVYINIEEGYKITDIVGQAHKLVDGEFDVVFPKDLTESLSKSYVSIVKLINILLITGGILLLIILVMVNTISMNQRKREIAVYRITGNSKKNVLVRILSEIVIAGSVGALLGCAIGILIIIPFGNYIGSLLE
ncbi:MAG: ABC transporter permease, partial [Lachnospiraceae bacterium]|nr:ABC transporter permease [Lachnospiraceae bacterium]